MGQDVELGMIDQGVTQCGMTLRWSCTGLGGADVGGRHDEVLWKLARVRECSSIYSLYGKCDERLVVLGLLCI
jgi:hypothetical protein